MQRHHKGLITPLTSCVRNSSSTLSIDALSHMISITHASAERDTELMEQALASSHTKGIALLTQHYRDSSYGRDIEMALIKNLMNPLITDIYLFNEEEFDFSHLSQTHLHKIHQVLLQQPDGGGAGRLLFTEAFDFAKTALTDRIVIVGELLCTNTDVHVYTTQALTKTLLPCSQCRYSI